MGDTQLLFHNFIAPQLQLRLQWAGIMCVTVPVVLSKRSWNIVAKGLVLLPGQESECVSAADNTLRKMEQ